MAGDGVNVPLLLRTSQTLRERFAALRDLGPVAAVLEEEPRDATPREGSKPSQSHADKLPFAELAGLSLRRWLGSVVEREGQITAVRSVWIDAGNSAASRILRLCREANGFVPFVRRTYGLPESCGSGNAQARWIWTVFELAEMRPPFTVLSLGGCGEVFRCSEDGTTVAESFVAVAADSPDDRNPFFELARRQTFLPQRYWQLDDLIEASIAVMDLVEVAIPSLAEDEGSQAAANGSTVERPSKVEPGGDEDPEDTTRKVGRRRKRTAEGWDVDQWVLAMAAGDPSFRHLSEIDAAERSGGYFGARTIGTCEMWLQMKTLLAAEQREKAERAAAELADRLGEDEDGHGLRLSSTKHGTGRQRTSREDLEHERKVDAFFLSKGEQSRKKRAKKRTK
jgi:hypothetical protein